MIERPVATAIAIGLVGVWYYTMHKCFSTPKPKYK